MAGEIEVLQEDNFRSMEFLTTKNGPVLNANEWKGMCEIYE